MSDWTPKVGDIVGWALLPDGDELEVTKTGLTYFVARRGNAETFLFDGSEDPAPYLIEHAA